MTIFELPAVRRVVDVVDGFIAWYIPWYRGPMPNDIYPDWRRLRHRDTARNNRPNKGGGLK